MIDYCNSGGALISDSTQSCADRIRPRRLPPGDYQAAQPWTNLVGTPLDGVWKIVVTDLWPYDNGFIFSWSISFDPNLVSDCSGPIVGFQQ